MDKRVVSFRRGDENRVVIEKNDKNALFSIQYRIADNILKRIRKAQDLSSDQIFSMVNNTIAFCGDRGVGKTSCMLSYKDSLSKEKVLALDMIDPSFFDDDHNIIDLLLAKLYYYYTNHIESNTECNRDVLELFAKVKLLIKDLDKTRQQLYDPMENIIVVDAGMRLKESMAKLMKQLLTEDKKEFILITIDDLDTKVSDIYKMSEQIRKYLSNTYCVILISVNIEQLQYLLAVELKKENDNNTDWYKDLAIKYILKFLPRDQRVELPKFSAFANEQVEIFEDFSDKKHPFDTIRESVLQLIFSKTRYLF